MLRHIRCKNGLAYAMRISGCIRIPDANVRMSDLARFDIPTLDTGTLSFDLRNANVTPVFKKGDKHLAENYRPVP